MSDAKFNLAQTFVDQSLSIIVRFISPILINQLNWLYKKKSQGEPTKKNAMDIRV
jgi:hypothetical protein